MLQVGAPAGILDGIVDDFLDDLLDDPEVPPLPPHIRFEQAKGLAQALAKGDPEAVRIVKQSLKGKL